MLKTEDTPDLTRSRLEAIAVDLSLNRPGEAKDHAGRLAMEIFNAALAPITDAHRAEYPAAARLVDERLAGAREFYKRDFAAGPAR